MPTNDEVKLALEEVSIHLTRTLEALEAVPDSSEAREAFPKEDHLRVQELLARAGGIVATSEQYILDCRMRPIYSEAEEEE